MDTLSAEQIASIKKYWEARGLLNKEVDDIEFRIEVHFTCYHDNCDDNTEFDQKIIFMQNEIEKVKEKICELDADYEKMLESYGIELYNRDMDEVLFAFINDGDFE